MEGTEGQQKSKRKHQRQTEEMEEKQNVFDLVDAALGDLLQQVNLKLKESRD